MTQQNNIRKPQPDESLTLMDMLSICLRRWPWFVLSVAICLSAVTLYLLSTPKVYTRAMSIRVKNSSGMENGRGSDDMAMYERIGIGNLRSNIDDEVVAIHSPAVLFEVVRRLHLDVNYSRPGFFQDKPLYASNLPVEVEFHDMNDWETASFTLHIHPDETITLSNITHQNQEVPGELTLKLGVKHKTSLGCITVTPAKGYWKGMTDEILVQRIGYGPAAGYYGARVAAAVQKETSSIIDIYCNDVLPNRAENILNTIVAVYNEQWVKNRNQAIIATNEFIMDRLAVIEQELSDVENNMADYLSANVLTGGDAMGNKSASREQSTDNQILEIETQLYMLRYLRTFVTDPANDSRLLPAAVGAADAQITEYNTMMLERNNLVSNSSEQNPLVRDMDVKLRNLREAILVTIDNARLTLNAQLSDVTKRHDEALGKVSQSPRQANQLRSIERQQSIKEKLYIFLLQRREENELSQAFTAYNTRILAAPYGSSKPTSPDQNKILMIAFAIGLALPAAFFIYRESTNTTVRGRKDIEHLTVPYIGELPLWRAKKGEEHDGYQIVVRQHSRDITNEAFRVVRTNLEFMLNPEKKCKTVMLTSFNPGSGKTFICANLGASFAIRGSRVICIDLDLRRASLSEYAGSPKQGITDYLSGHTDDFKSLIVNVSVDKKKEENADGKDSSLENDSSLSTLHSSLPKEDSSLFTLHSSLENTKGILTILPVGKMPPNPTELLYSPRLKPMLDELRRDYDYVFIDCPPVEIVADATIISHESDVTLFVVRSGLLERSMLPELEKNYEDKKYNNMAMILNGTDADHHYGYHRYGYAYGRYGYGYGYGKRYGYGYYGKK